MTKEQLEKQNKLLKQQLQSVCSKLNLSSNAPSIASCNTASLSALHYSPVTAIITNNEGLIVYENEAMRALWKYEKDDTAIGINILNIEPSKKIGLDAALRDIYSGKKDVHVISGVSFASVVTNVVAYVNISVSPKYDGNNIEGAIIQIMDFTDLERSRQLNENIFTHCPAGIVICDKTGIVVKHNKAIGIGLGDKDINLIGVDLFELKSLLPYRGMMRDVFHHGTPIYNRRIHFVSDFTQKPVHLNIWFMPIYQGNHVDQVMIIQHEITTLIEAENALIKLSRTDDLTGLANRREIKERLTSEEGRCQTQIDGGFSICIADVDFFKRINDRYGHPVGDEVLKSISVTLAKEVRDVDVVARWGGEEFLIFLPGADTHEALMAMERLRGIVERLKISFGRELLSDASTENKMLRSNHENQVSRTVTENTVSVTMSFGVFTYRKGMSLELALQHADQRLYKAKQNGRNQVVASPVRH